MREKNVLKCFIYLFVLLDVVSMSWIERKSSGSRQWSSVALSNSRYLATSSGDIYYSDDGTLWSPFSIGINAWNSIQTSIDGKYMIAGQSYGYLYISVNSGETWKTSNQNQYQNWNDVAISDDGNKMMAISRTYLFVSSDQGSTWPNSYPTQNPRFIAISSNGMIVAIGRSDSICISTNDGSSCISSNYGSYSSVAMSKDGSRIMVTQTSGYLLISIDGGNTWVQQTSLGSQTWSSIATSMNGMTILASVRSGYLYLSKDGGENWIQQTEIGMKDWTSAAVSPLADRLLASVSFGYLYTMTIDCEIGSYIKPFVGCVPCPGNLISFVENSIKCECPNGYYLLNEMTCEKSPSNMFGMKSKAAIITFACSLNVIYLAFHILHPHLSTGPKIYYFIMFLLPHLTFLLHILYWVMESFKSKTIYILYGLTILFPIFPYLRVLWKIKSKYFVPESYSRLYKYLFWLSVVDEYPGIYNERIIFIPYHTINSSIFQVLLLTIIWSVAIIVQLISFIPILIYSIWLFVSYLTILTLGYLLYQMKILCFNYVWNIWVELYVGPKQNNHNNNENENSNTERNLVQEFFKEPSDLIDISLFNESLLSQIIYETSPHLILQLINIIQISKKQSSLSIVTLVFTLLYLLLVLMRIIYWSWVESIPLEQHPIRFFPKSISLPLFFEKYSFLNNNEFNSTHEIIQVKKMLDEQTEQMKLLQDTIRQLKEEKGQTTISNGNNEYDNRSDGKNVESKEFKENKEEVDIDIENKRDESYFVNGQEVSSSNSYKIESEEQHSLLSKQRENYGIVDDNNQSKSNIHIIYNTSTGNDLKTDKDNEESDDNL